MKTLPAIESLKPRSKTTVRRPAKGRGGNIRRGRRRKARTFVQRDQVIAFLSAFGEAANGLGPLAFLKVGPRTLLEHAVRRLSMCIGTIVIVAPEAAVPAIRAQVGKSVRIIGAPAFNLAAVKAQVQNAAVQVVAVHDVRWAFASSRLVTQVLMSALDTGAATVATNISGSVAVYKEGLLSPLPDLERAHLSHCPQAYLYGTLLEFAERKGWGNTPLDSLWQFVGDLGDQVTAVENELTNLRVTNAVELAIAQRVIVPELQKRRAPPAKPAG